MTINTDLLIAAPMLQDYLVDKDTGKPLANGIVSLYKDTARSFYKNWYYQTGIPGAYTYVALDNPLHLSSVGTIQDPNGNDVIPFYYPYDEDDQNQPEAYYVTVYSVDENGDQAVLQFTRENFPFNPTGQNPTLTNSCWRNYILNNVYWRNIGTLDAMDVLDQVIAPSQHDGYTNGDIRFIKNVTGANDDLAFLPISEELPTSQTPNGAITPEYMINMQCTGVQLGETAKCIQYPISLHVKTLNSVQGTIVFYGQNVAGNANNFVDLYFYQYLGTGALAQPDPILIQRVTLNNSFQEFQIPFVTPSTDGLVLGAGGDDALFLRVQYPLSALFGINHTKPQIYFSADVPSNDFDTYDQIESIINSPRTGDYKNSINSFQPFGYIAANDGVISNSGTFVLPAGVPSARQNIDTWPLFKLIWENVLNVFAPIYNSDGTTGTRGANAYVDWTANKQLRITRALGRVLMGLPTSATFTYNHLNSLLTVPDASLYYFGSPVVLSNTGGALPDAFTAGTVYYVIPFAGNTIKLASSYANAINRTPVGAGTTDGTGTNTIAFTLGGYFGEGYHTQTLDELVPHHHNVPFFTVPNVLSSGGGHDDIHTSPATDTSTTGGGGAFNIIQPSTYVNVFIKL